MNDRWGLSMAGCEETILNAVGVVASSTDGIIRYLEIGCANCETLAQVCRALQRTGRRWHAIGLDLPVNADGFIIARPWCQDAQAARDNIAEFGEAVELDYGVSWEWLDQYREWINTHHGMFELAMIDGCHEKECIKRDFLALEPMIAFGGCVIFHDTAEWSQGIDPQPHLGLPIEARKALAELNLLPPLRAGWAMVGVGDGRQSEGGRGCTVYQRRSP
jgi:hypothetical protein